VFAHVVRYEVGRQENAEAFVDEVIRGFGAAPPDVPGLVGSLLLTREADGEAIQLLLFESEEAALAAEDRLLAQPAPDTGAREVVTGRRPDSLGGPLWKAWQGQWSVRTDPAAEPGPPAAV
jgi:hypothetical protein